MIIYVHRYKNALVAELGRLQIEIICSKRKEFSAEYKLCILKQNTLEVPESKGHREVTLNRHDPTLKSCFHSAMARHSSHTKHGNCQIPN